ncbi:MAG: hypothetical protein WCO40_07155 [Thermoleophilia bacterium]
MPPAPIDLTKCEERVRNGALIVIVLGNFGFRVFGNITHIWWPAISFILTFAIFTVGFMIYVARTRKRSFRSVAAFGLPDFVTRRMSQTQRD